VTARLITIPFSHYCEKARWALDLCGVPYREDGHLPLFHYLATFPARGRRTVPVVVDGSRVLRDSTDIVAWADEHRPGVLLPSEAGRRREALALEDELDRQLGPATRRWGYFQLLPRRDLAPILGRGVPRWEFVALGLARPIVFGALRRGLNITAEGAARSRDKIDATFARVGELLRDGRRYLIGDQLTVADLTFAALASPVLGPPEHPHMQLPAEAFAGAAHEQAAGWRDSPAGRFALRIYADHRR